MIIFKRYEALPLVQRQQMCCIVSVDNMLLKVLFSIFISCVIICCRSTKIPSFTACNHSFFHPVIISSSVLLPCHGLKGADIDWTYNTEVLNILTFITNDHLRESVLVSENFSLSIHNVSYSHEGSYQCSSNGSLLVEHILQLIGLYCWTFICECYTTCTSPQFIYPKPD